MPADSPDFQAATDIAPIALGTVPINPGATQGQATFTVPGTATGIEVVVSSTLTLTSVQVDGGTTGFRYMNQTTPTSSGAFYSLPIRGANEATVTVTCNVTPAYVPPFPGIVAWVSALTGTGIVAAYSSGVAGLFQREAVPGTILAGSVAATTGAGTVIVTIPAGRTWRGSVGGVIVAVAKASVQVAGAGATPAAGTILCEQQLLSLSGAGAVMSATGVYVQAPAGNAVTINGIASVNATTDAWANGVLLGGPAVGIG